MPGYVLIFYCVGAVAAAVIIIFVMRAVLYRLVDRRISAYQNSLVARHCEEVQSIYLQMRGWRHDYHNHIQTMKAFRALGKNNKLDEYLAELETDLSGIDTVLKTGNVMADAILNSKISLAKSRRIAVIAKAMVPAELTVSEIDLCVIIGNLLDNAIEANMRLAEETQRLLRMYIDVKGDTLYLSVTNASGGEIITSAGRFLSAKPGGSHGFGLMRVERLVDKYKGYIKCRHEEGAFTAEILLPL